MVNERYGIAISETLHYLKGIQQQDIDKIPHEFMEFLENNCLKNYKCNFDYTRPLKELNISNEARGMIAMICLNYWCDNEEKKKMLKKHLIQNEIKYQEKLRKTYNPNEVFKDRNTNNKDINHNIQEQSKEEYDKNLPMIVQKQNVIQRLLKFIKKHLMS